MTTTRKFTIGIVDTSTVKYFGSSAETEFLPVAQAAVVNIAEELFKIGFFVTVLNSGNQIGLHNFVNYQSIESLKERDYQFDIVISIDSVLPFNLNGDSIFEQVRRSDQLKILWAHRIDFEGNELLEKLVKQRQINQIFTVGDRHTNDVINGLVGPRRMYETLKNRVFQTRYGVREGHKTDPILFISAGQFKYKKHKFAFNYSDHRSAELLIEKIWPKIKQKLSGAELLIVADPGNNDFNSLRTTYNNQNDVTFCTDGSYRSRMSSLAGCYLSLYPSLSWDNNHINLLECVNNNVPVLGFATSSFLEVVGKNAGVVVKNTVDQDIETLTNEFAEAAVFLVNDNLRHQQYMYGCNLTKEILNWSTVALQWKQHFYSTFGLRMDSVEQQQVQWINYRVNEITQKTFINPAEISVPENPTNIDSIKYGPLTMAFIDLSGASYDGDTLRRRGLGGSESAVISMSRELAKLGFAITVFNACNEDDCRPGLYDGVEYLPLTLIQEQSAVYDVVISLRTPEVFADHRQNNIDFGNPRKLPLEFYELLQKSRYRVLWMHDTFSRGDELVQQMVINNQIDEVWTLSDFHRNYFLNCNHGNQRHYSLLQDRVWTTRNGINRYVQDVNLAGKDSNLFVYNANQSKGLKPLLRNIWPEVKKRIPDARLTVIGGYYELGAIFSKNRELDEFNRVINDYKEDSSITFTGIVTQEEVAKIVHGASFFIYPCDLPETFGISAWESLAVGTPLITCRFGALEETAVESGSWLIDQPVTSNSLFPDIDTQSQIDQFVNCVVDAYNNKELLTEKQNLHKEIADISEWSVVALEWKQRIYQKHERYLSKTETQRINYTTSKYRKLTGRRTANHRHQVIPFPKHENRFIIVSTFKNAGNLLENCILSVAAQNYSNYHHILVNDCSTDHSAFVAQLTIQNLPGDMQSKFTLINREQSYGAVYNQVDVIRKLQNNEIVILLDGDDFLANRTDILSLYNEIYNQGAEFTYGSIWSQADRIPLIAQPYDDFTRQHRNYRSVRFNWYIPYTHLRTFRKYLINNIPDTEFQDNKSQWFRAGGDVAVFYALLEQARPEAVHVINDIVYIYNDNLNNNDFRSNSDEQSRNAQMIIKGEHRNKVNKRVLIAIPTAKYIEPTTFKAIYDQQRPKDVEVDFQFFYGYNVDQVRNLIAHWAVNGYDYLWAVDSDISFPPDTLRRLLEHNRDVVSAVYRQRIPGTYVVELYEKNNNGGVSNIPWENLRDRGLVEVDACGFGCVLIKSDVLRAVGYPQFEYHSAINHEHTISEDVDFCRKARDRGYKIYADTSILCDHYGQIIFGMNQ